MPDRITRNGRPSSKRSVDLGLGIFDWRRGPRTISTCLPAHVEQPLDPSRAIRVPEVWIRPVDTAVEDEHRYPATSDPVLRLRLISPCQGPHSIQREHWRPWTGQQGGDSEQQTEKQRLPAKVESL